MNHEFCLQEEIDALERERDAMENLPPGSLPPAPCQSDMCFDRLATGNPTGSKMSNLRLHGRYRLKMM